MSLFDRIRVRRQRDAPPAGMVPADKLAAQAWREAGRAPVAGEQGDRDLLARRERLTERFALLQADLGGVFYEMAIRDHVRMDVLTRKAAELQRVDADLAQIERELHGNPLPAPFPTGACSACGTPHDAQARFCPSCGQPLAASLPADPTAQTVVQQISRTNGSSGAAP
ncbi:MAG TPA: zinc ribbon domain-containing protein [Conexibacter sp.]|nr:zinc ribbon domain-containing protein [Conexibacter sp.]